MKRTALRWYEQAALLVTLAIGATCGKLDGQVIVLPRDVRASLTGAWIASNAGYATGRQRELLGCLLGVETPETVYVYAWTLPRNLQQLPTAVNGDCSIFAGLIGAFHTHPYIRADETHYYKAPNFSKIDVLSFTADTGLHVALMIWDVDSVRALVRQSGVRDGTVVVR